MRTAVSTLTFATELEEIEYIIQTVPLYKEFLDLEKKNAL